MKPGPTHTHTHAHKRHLLHYEKKPHRCTLYTRSGAKKTNPLDKCVQLNKEKKQQEEKISVEVRGRTLTKTSTHENMSSNDNL